MFDHYFRHKKHQDSPLMRARLRAALVRHHRYMMHARKELEQAQRSMSKSDRRLAEIIVSYAQSVTDQSCVVHTMTMGVHPPALHPSARYALETGMVALWAVRDRELLSAHMRKEFHQYESRHDLTRSVLPHLDWSKFDSQRAPKISPGKYAFASVRKMWPGADLDYLTWRELSGESHPGPLISSARRRRTSDRSISGRPCDPLGTATILLATITACKYTTDAICLLLGVDMTYGDGNR